MRSSRQAKNDRLKKDFEVESDDVRVDPATSASTRFPHIVKAALDLLGDGPGETCKQPVLIDVIFTEIDKELLGNVGLKLKRCQLDREVEGSFVPEAVNGFFMFPVSILDSGAVAGINIEQLAF